MPYPNGFAPVAGREELRSAMRNRFYDNVSRPGHYGFLPHDVVTADMVPLGASKRARGMRGLGDVCDDEGAALGVGIAAAVMRLGGSLLEESGRSTVGDGGAKTGGDTGRAGAGRAASAGADALVDAWTASCLSATRGSTTGASPGESMDSVLARARAEWAATADSDREDELYLDERRAEREAAAAATNRNYMIAAAIGAVIVIGGVVYFTR